MSFIQELVVFPTQMLAQAQGNRSHGLLDAAEEDRRVLAQGNMALCGQSLGETESPHLWLKLQS